jgi:hypothetical protein
MARVIITRTLKDRVLKRFGGEAEAIFSKMLSLGSSPKNGKHLTSIGSLMLGEIRFRSYRFYYITDAHKVKFLSVHELEDLIIRFVEYSDKKHQQETIEELKQMLRSIRTGS